MSKADFNTMPEKLQGKTLQDLHNGFNSGKYTLDEIIVMVYKLGALHEKENPDNA